MTTVPRRGGSRQAPASPARETNKPRYERARALVVAENLVERFAPLCTEIVIAGSIRRNRQEVSDIEIVMLPNVAEPWHIARCRIDSALIAMGQEGTLGKHISSGELYKRYPVQSVLAHSMGLYGIHADLFFASEKNFGNILAIRTGPADFWRGLFAAAEECLGIRQEGGVLRQLYRADGQPHAAPPIIPCRNEEDYFDAFGLDYIEPPYRDAELAIRFAAQLRRKYRRSDSEFD